MENTEVQNAPKKKGKLGLLLGIGIPVLVVLIVVGIFAGISINKNNRYEDALQMLDDGDIEDAVEVHAQLGDYKDLSTQICDAAADEFEDQLEDGKYKDAIRTYAAVVSYPDAMEELNEQLEEHVTLLAQKYNMDSIGNLYKRAVKEEAGVDQIVKSLVASMSSWLDDEQYYAVMDVYGLLKEQSAAIEELNALLAQKFEALLAEDMDEAEDLYDVLESYEIHLDAVYKALYDLACSWMEDPDHYYDAWDLFAELGEYEDAAAKIEQIKLALAKADLEYYLNKGWFDSALEFIEEFEGVQDELIEIYKSYCGDGTFVADLEAALKARAAAQEQENCTYEDLINAELNILSKYKKMPFYDARLGELAKQYLNGLYGQQDALDEKDNYVFYYDWHIYAADRYEALLLLKDEYGYAANDMTLQGLIRDPEKVRTFINAWQAIHNDLASQLWYAYTVTDENGNQYLAYTNDTSYTFDLYIAHSFETYGGNVVSAQYGEYLTVTPGMELRIYVQIPEEYYSDWYVDWEIANISENGTSLEY